MRRYLPIIILLFLFAAPLVSFFGQSTFAQVTTAPQVPTRAQVPPTAPPLPTEIPENAQPPLQEDEFVTPTAGPIPTGTWVEDGTVTFSGKSAARAGLLLNWTLRDYQWYTPLPGQSTNPLYAFWTQIRNIVYAFLIVIVLVTAFILIITRGKSIRAKIFIPRFIGVVLLITFSFSLLQFIYQMADIIMGFFLRVGDDIIQNQDLLFVGWDYRSYYGLRMYGQRYEESAFITLLFVRLTALTYYVMIGMLIIRKIILWFFIIVSPIFPLLLLYYPVRNTGKIWIGEFFRWLLYGPLFAIFLGGLVSLWRQGIPMNFNFDQAGKFREIIFPTAVNIVLAGPKQAATMTNNMNLPDTFALYLVSLLMLWAVVIVPWILLRIFLDYAQGFFSNSGAAYLKLPNRNPKTPPPNVPPPAPFGIAREVPIGKTFTMPTDNRKTGMAREIPRDRTQQVQIPKVNMLPVQETRQILRDIKVTVPTIRDIAKLETRKQEVTVMKQQLQNIANPASITNIVERQKFTEIRDRLVKESQTGNLAATNILNAAKRVAAASSASLQSSVQTIMRQISNPALVTSITQRIKVTQIKQRLEQEKAKGNPIAVRIVKTLEMPIVTKEEAEKVKADLKAAEDKGDPLAIALLAMLAQAQEAQQPATPLPSANRVQQVSLDDYEAIKSMWTENYQTMDVPQSIHGQMSRKDWVSDDINEITTTINLLSSSDVTRQQEGMKQVSNILPFLMIGGFSQNEIVSYLKAKLEAAKAVKAELMKKETDEESMVETKKREAEAQKTMTMAAEMDKPNAPKELPENPIPTAGGPIKKPDDNSGQGGGI
jgi:hypothetical protein